MSDTIAPPELAPADKQLVRETNVRAGGKLSNGATLLIETKPIRRRTEVVTTTVLCVVDEGYHPFVVWTRCRDLSDAPAGHRPKIVDYCIEGDYFRRLDDALSRFEDRSIGCELVQA